MPDQPFDARTSYSCPIIVEFHYMTSVINMQHSRLSYIESYLTQLLYRPTLGVGLHRLYHKKSRLCAISVELEVAGRISIRTTQHATGHFDAA